ncbi:MAG: ComEC/Rec2 family competence protein [Clostridia bacterium]|nr:ComEC/Rec2 family competence protein [Clostridia bacterium]
MKRPFLTVGLTMLCTMFLLFTIGTLYTVILVAIVLAVSTVFVFLRHREATVAMLVGMAALIAVFSFSFMQNNAVNAALLYCGENISVCGTLADYPAEIGGRYVYRLKNCTLGNEPTSFSLHLSDEGYYNCAPGDVLEFTARKIYPSAEKDSEFYYSTMSGRVYLRAYTDQVTVLQAETHSLRYLHCEIRHAMLCVIKDRLQSTRAAVLSGLMLGNTDSLNTQTALYFSASGISHLFAVSGFHVSFWTGVLLHLFGKRNRHILPSLSACVFLFFFMALTGFSVSVCRSGLMAGVVFCGNMFRKEADSLNSLGLAVTVLLTLNPFSAADASLLLSAAATAAIILSSRPIEEYITTPLTQKIKYKSLRKLLHYISNLLCLSAAVTLALMPLTSYLFGSFSMMTPLANILCIPNAQGAMVIGMAAQVFNRIPYFSDFLFHLAGILLDLLLFFAKELSEIPVAMVILNTTFTVVWTAVSLLLIGLVYKKYNRLPRRAFFTAICCALSLMVMFNAFCYTNKDETVLTVYDTGNATCITLCDRNGNAAIIGCGGDEYLVESLAQKLRTSGVASPRLLLIPDTRETESANAWSLNRTLSPDCVITKQWDTVAEDNIIITNKANIQLWKNTELHFESVQDFRAVHIKTNGQDIVICAYPSSDFTDAESVYKSGDILICRQSIPATINTDRFKQILLSSDKKKELYYFDETIAKKITTTADEGSISILIK